MKNVFNFFRAEKRNLKIPAHIQELSSTTAFTVHEIVEFQNMFRSLCPKNSNHLKLKDFQKCMRMMCVKSNSYLIERIFTLIDTDKDNQLSFKEFIKYFNTLLKGDVNDKAELCFSLIAAGNEENNKRPLEKQFFSFIDLLELLILVQFTQEKSKLDDEGLFMLQGVARGIMEMLDATEKDIITMAIFRQKIEKNSEVLNIFEMMTDGIRDMYGYHNENQYSKVVRALNSVKERYARVLEVLAKSNVDEPESEEKAVQGLSFSRNSPGRRKKRFRSSILDNFKSKFKDLAKRGSLQEKQALNSPTSVRGAALANQRLSAFGKADHHGKAARISEKGESDHSFGMENKSQNRSRFKSMYSGTDKAVLAHGSTLENGVPSNRNCVGGKLSSMNIPSPILSPLNTMQQKSINVAPIQSLRLKPELILKSSKQFNLKPNQDPSAVNPTPRPSRNRLCSKEMENNSSKSSSSRTTEKKELRTVNAASMTEVSSFMNNERRSIPRTPRKLTFNLINSMQGEGRFLKDFEEVKEVVEAIESNESIELGKRLTKAKLKEMVEKGNQKWLGVDEMKRVIDGLPKFKSNRSAMVGSSLADFPIFEPDYDCFSKFEDYIEKKMKSYFKKNTDQFMDMIKDSQFYINLQEELSQTKQLLQIKERKHNRLKQYVFELRHALSSFKHSLDLLTEEFDRKMKEQIQKNKKQFSKQHHLDRIEDEFFDDSEDGSENNNNAKEVTITSELWETVILMTSGIEYSVNSVGSGVDFYTISDQDYRLKNTFEISHPSLGRYDKYVFIDYAPKVFNLIRQFNNISNEDYLRSLGPDSLGSVIKGKNLFKGLSSAGKSGSFFFTTADDKYYVKTIPDREFELAVEILDLYVSFLNSTNDSEGRPQTFITNIYGLHKIKFVRGPFEQVINIVVISNIFESGIKIHNTYDLKGSLFNRITHPNKVKMGAAKKDLNFRNEKMALRITTDDYDKIAEFIERDTKFLEQCKIIDYSLLVGVHDRQEALNARIERGRTLDKSRTVIMSGESRKRKLFSKKDDSSPLRKVSTFGGVKNGKIGKVKMSSKNFVKKQVNEAPEIKITNVTKKANKHLNQHINGKDNEIHSFGEGSLGQVEEEPQMNKESLSIESKSLDEQEPQKRLSVNQTSSLHIKKDKNDHSSKPNSIKFKSKAMLTPNMPDGFHKHRLESMKVHPPNSSSFSRNSRRNSVQGDSRSGTNSQGYSESIVNNQNVFQSICGRYIFVIGIIDPLTYFSNKKYLEYVSKCTLQSKDISCVPPKHYAQRFRDFMLNDVFKPILSDHNLTDFRFKFEKLIAEKRKRELEKKKELERKKTGQNLGLLGRELAKLGLDKHDVDFFKLREFKMKLGKAGGGVFPESKSKTPNSFG